MIATSKFALIALLQTAVLILQPSAALAESQVAGYVNGTQKVLSSFELANGNVAKRILFNLTVVTDDPENPIHLASQDCFATYVFTKEGKPVGGRGSCDGISADGHIWWLEIELLSDGKVRWVNRGGLGKFKNLNGSGSTSVLAEFSDGKSINRFEGSFDNQVE